METPLNLWDRQKGESDKNFSAFVCYRDLEPHERSAPNAAKADPGGRGAGHFKNLMKEFNWVERAQAWDDYQDKERQKSSLRIREAHDQELIKAFEATMKKVHEGIELIDPAKIGPQYLPRMLDTAAKISNMATGGRVKATGDKKGQSVEDIIEEEMEAFQAAQAKEKVQDEGL